MPAPIIRAIALCLTIGLGNSPSAQAATTTETILFIRHGEKSPTGLGQLSCRGLNRALALPAVLAGRYKRIDAIFAPDPSRQKQDGALSYDYVRPLATVEPTAIRFGLPVHAAIGYDATDTLIKALEVPEFRDKTVLVAWEHHALNALVPAMIKGLGGDPAAVPEWTRPDFDTIWHLTIGWTGDHASVAFAREAQGLDGQSDLCPNAGSVPVGPRAAPLLDKASGDD